MSSRKQSSKAPAIQRVTALCYIRQSWTRDQNDTNSPERQRANIQAVCERKGWIPEWYVDAEGHKSGRFEANRPEWLRLKKRLVDPDVVALVTNDLARLHRKSWHVGRTVEELDTYGVVLVFAAPGREIDTSTPYGRLALNFIAMQDEAYATDIAQRVKDSIHYRKGKGITVGIPPFGTVRDEKGFLAPTPCGAWLLPSGRYVSGDDKDTPPQPDAVWFGYYDCAHRILELYAKNAIGYNKLAKQLTKEGWMFRDRWNKPRLISSADVRRITSNWREYAGIIMNGRAKERIASEIENPTSVLRDTGHAVFDLDLLRRVAEVQEQRSITIRPTGSTATVYDYALLRLVYCAHCERLSVEQDNSRRRSRLGGTKTDKARYRHAEGVHCGCERRSVPAELLEDDFFRLVRLLTIKEEALSYMIELAAQSEHGDLDEDNLEQQRQAAIAKHRRKIEAARFLFEEGEMSKQEFVKKKEENERMIVHWEARTTETQKKALELSACMTAFMQLVQSWEDATGEERLSYARGLFEYIVYDLDKRQIVDFRLHPWADQYLILRADMLYPDENGGEDEDGNENRFTSYSSDEAIVDPNETRTRVFTLKG